MPADALYDDDIVTAAQQQARVIGDLVRTQRKRAPFGPDAKSLPISIRAEAFWRS